MKNYNYGCLQSIASRGKRIEQDFKILPDTNFDDGYSAVFFLRFWSFSTNVKNTFFGNLTSLVKL